MYTNTVKKYVEKKIHSFIVQWSDPVAGPYYKLAYQIERRVDCLVGIRS